MLFTWRGIRKRVRDVLHLADTPPQRLAASLAVGVFISCTPFYGFHTLLAIATAYLFRLNKAAIVTGAWLNLPWFAPFVYGASLKVGEFILTGGEGLQFLKGLSLGELSAMIEPYLSMDQLKEGFLLFSRLMFDLSKPLLVGTTVLGACLALITYVAALSAIQKLRQLQAEAGRSREP